MWHVGVKENSTLRVYSLCLCDCNTAVRETEGQGGRDVFRQIVLIAVLTAPDVRHHKNRERGKGARQLHVLSISMQPPPPPPPPHTQSSTAHSTTPVTHLSQPHRSPCDTTATRAVFMAVVHVPLSGNCRLIELMV